MPKSDKMEILTARQSDQKIERMAYQMLEKHSGEKELILAGIDKRGYQLAEHLEKRLKDISDMKVRLVKVSINKQNPFDKDPKIDCDTKEIEGKSVIVVDDVLNSGRTMLFAMMPFLEVEIKSLAVAVLCNRSYRNYPVEANFVGLSLSTTIQEHIEVQFDNKGGIKAYLV